MNLKVRSLNLLALLSFFLLITLSISSHALTCAELLSSFSAKSTTTKVDSNFSDILASKVSEANSVEGLLGRKLKIEDILGFVGSRLPENLQNDFVSKASERFSGLSINRSDRPFHRIGIRYKNRLVNYSLNRSRATTIRWSDRVVESREELFELVDRTIDIWAETAFLPIRMSSIYRASRDSFQGNNIEAIKDKILLKLFTLRGEVEIPDHGPVRGIWNKTKSLFKAFLPLHYTEIRSAKLTEEHLRTYEEHGPQGLYELIRSQHGLGLAVKYWFTHLANTKVALFTVYTAFMAPQVMHTYDFIVSEQSIQVPSAQYKTAYRLLEVMRSPPEQLLVEIEGHISTLPSGEKALVENFITDVRFKFNPPEQVIP